ncbi:MAG: hypothetical protein O3A38_08855, partial [Proteobacteria bacterium]|nr:hypothetical protein [Pseudomonadota bacterium]
MKDIAQQTDAVKSMMTWDPPVYGQFGMKPELVNYASEDERLWVPIAPNVWYRPLFFDMTTGSHC